MGVILGNILGNIFYVITFVIAANVFAEFQWRKTYQNYVIAFLITIAGSIFVSRSEFALFFLPVQIIEIVVILEIIFGEKIKRTLGCVMLFTLIHATMLQIIEASLTAIQIIIKRNIEVYFPIIESTAMLLFVIIMAMVKKRTLWGKDHIKRQYIYILAVILVVDSGLLIEIGDYISKLNDGGHKVMSAVNYIFVVAVILLEAIAIVYLILSRDVFKEREELAEKFLEEQRLHYEYLSDRDYKTKKFRHDLKNHMNLLAQFCQEDDLQKVKQYLDEINIHINDFGNKINTHNGIADAILNRYYEECKNSGIELKVKGHFEPECNISTFDMCTILSNLLDNALRAEKEAGGLEIDCLIRNTDDKKIIILIENDCKKEAEMKNGRYVSSKKNKESHGLGIENVKECVGKNNGCINIEAADKKFRVWICMDNTGV